MNSHFTQSRLIWSPADPNFAAVEVFRRVINHKHGLNLKNYHDLHKYSVENYTFWLDLWNFLAVIHSVPPSQILVHGPRKESPIWFPGAKLNFAENLLCHNDDSIACTASGESGIVTHYSFRQLRQMVKEMAAALRVNGLVVGDRVAAVITNSITAVVLALATTSVGGIFSTTSTDMGAQGILDRYRQIQPKFIFSDTEVSYAGKTVDLLPKVSEVASGLGESISAIILLPSTVTGRDLSGSSSRSIPKSISLSAFLATGDGRELSFEQLPFSHPVYIMYSSGTSGPPKCIVHSVGGLLLQSKKDITLVFGLRRGETLFQYTTTGWMMWPFMINALSCGIRIILYDGSPFYPDVRKFLKFVSVQGVSVLGTAPRFLAEVQGENIHPLDIGTFESLRSLFVTGAVLTPPMYEWTHQAFGKRMHIMAGCGGTDVCAAFVTSVPSLPVHAGEIQAKSLGMKVEVFDPSGKNIEHTGEAGELVCTRPHPSIPLYLWGDHLGEKFHKSYFDTYPGVWHQGDFMVINPDTKGIIILGRSDGVLNPGGVRFGTSEIYTVLAKFTAILDDTLCVGQRRPQDKDERVLLFLKLRPGHAFTKQLVDRIKSAIREDLSARHVPAFIFPIEDIPYTVNGKKIEIAVKQIVSGSNLTPSGTVANPDSLQLYYKFRDIEHVADGEGREAKL